MQLNHIFRHCQIGAGQRESFKYGPLSELSLLAMRMIFGWT
jgi:hypothetical protein